MWNKNLTFKAVPSRMPKLSSNPVNYALMERFVCLDVKYIVVKAEKYLIFLRTCLFLVKNCKSAVKNLFDQSSKGGALSQ